MPEGSTSVTPAERAVDAWRALHDHCLYRRGDSVLALEGPGRAAGGAPLWPFSQVLAAAIDLAGLTGDHEPLEALRRGLERYRVGDAYGPNPGVRTRYYDDNAWIALDLLRWHDLTGEARHLDDAARLLAFLLEGESPDGGVWWVEHPKQSRHTCSTAPAEQIALRLAARRDDPNDEAFARRCDAFLDQHLRAPSGLYWDNIDRSGRVEPTHWSYNQGTPIGADVLWFERTGDRSRLDRAAQTAAAALQLYGDDDGWWRQPAAFNGVFFRELLALHERQPDPRYLDVLDAYLDRAWRDARDPGTGLLLGGGIGRYEGGGTIDHAALVQLYALRSNVS